MGANTSESLRMLGDDVTSNQFGVVYCLWVLVICLIIAGCGTTQHTAPVVDYSAVDIQSSLDSTDGTLDEEGRFYVVQRGDTLYSIALDHGINLKELAEWNNITNPGAIQLGQRINLSVPSTQSQTSPQTQPLLIALPHQGLSAENTPAVEMPQPTSGMERAGDRLITEPKALVLPYSDRALV
ncbi:MAG: LysM peptidoglycan-binding domain-containing protein, partial [Nitrosomonas sp.]|nr:LysM peptidoglycan-binding domain-containing protein [Nitrosomonas sp.]